LTTYLTLIQELAEVTLALKEATASKAWDNLLPLLEQRQAVIDQVEALPTEAMPATEQERQEALSLLKAIAESDQQNTAILEASMEAIRPELQAGQATRSTISAYQRTGRVPRELVPARFVDKQR
jgi:hypothetical protein